MYSKLITLIKKHILLPSVILTALLVFISCKVAIDPPTQKTQVLFVGTSITFGSESLVSPTVHVASNQTFPACVAAFFANSTSMAGWDNFGVPGATVPLIISSQLPLVIGRKNTANYSQTVVLMEEGINDMPLYSVQEIYNNIKQSHQALHSAGIKTIVVTPTMINNDYQRDLKRLQLISMLQAGYKSDIGAIDIVDLSQDPLIGVYPTTEGINLTVYQADGVHFTPYGYSVIAKDVEKVLVNLKL